MGSYKNIITWTVKIGIGLGSFLLIYWRLNADLSPEKILFIKNVFTDSSSYALLLFCVLLIPINWGIESYKWQMITKSVEPVFFSTAMKSVYSGVCVGNLAPGRATEFLAKILFFKPENRPTITLLHFVNGMIQLSVTILIGISCLFLRSEALLVFAHAFVWLVIFAIALLIVFILIIFNFKKLHAWVFSKFRKPDSGTIQEVQLSKKTIAQLLLWSFIRYAVFSFQFILVLKLFYTGSFTLEIIEAVGVYFLLTTALPMISFIEAFIRAAVALIVFQGLNISETPLVITAILVWLLNIVLPSIIGYIIIVKEKFEFNLFKQK